MDTLRRRIGRIDELQLGAIMCKSLMGMRYLNKSHVVHRDIKPSNILINTRGQVKLCDFGTSKILHEKSVSLRRTGPTPPILSHFASLVHCDHGAQVQDFRRHPGLHVAGTFKRRALLAGL